MTIADDGYTKKGHLTTNKYKIFGWRCWGISKTYKYKQQLLEKSDIQTRPKKTDNSFHFQ